MRLSLGETTRPTIQRHHRAPSEPDAVRLFVAVGLAPATLVRE